MIKKPIIERDSLNNNIVNITRTFLHKWQIEEETVCRKSFAHIYGYTHHDLDQFVFAMKTILSTIFGLQSMKLRRVIKYFVYLI